jgi:2-methylisocitrate lyase-like PEP mutase family enzyme
MTPTERSAHHARFVALHGDRSPLVLANAWDAASGRLIEELGAPAVATSSAAVAWARGHADGGVLPRSETLDVVRGMARVLSIPLSIDVEDGYSDRPDEVAALVRDVAEAGAVGINLEDGGGSPDLLAAKIRAIRVALGDTPLFVNARTDVYLRGLATGAAAVAATIERLDAYRTAGADGAFVPGLADSEEIASISAAVALPLNVMVVPGLPDLARLHSLGVRRLSAGPALFEIAYARARDAARGFLAGDFAALSGARLDYAETNRMFEAH